MQKNTKKKQKRRKIRLSPFAYLLIAAVLLTGYGIGVYHYSSHFYNNTRINGKKVGGKTAEQAKKIFTDQDYDSHAITLIEQDGEETITPEQVSLVVNVGTQLSDALEEQSPWTWIFHLIGKQNLTIALDISYDEEALSDTLDQMEAFQDGYAVAPEDAYITAGKEKFVIEEEVYGSTIDKEHLMEEINVAFTTDQTEINLVDEGLYKTPSVLSTDANIKAALETANTYASAKITYDFDYTTEIVDYDTIKDWVTFSDDYSEVGLDETALDTYVTQLGDTYNTMGKARDFVTTKGTTVHITEGDYGWLINHDSEVAQLQSNIKSGEEYNRKPIYSYTGETRKSATNDIGDSYVEVSIEDQMIYLYIDGQIVVRSAVVTGDVTQGDDYTTHTGVYGITYKQRQVTLSGVGFEGKEYQTPVEYWMPFNGNEGIHDASWRSSFGGSIYKGNGSHGCVNCPVNVAKTIYKYVGTGFPVVIY